MLASKGFVAGKASLRHCGSSEMHECRLWTLYPNPPVCKDVTNPSVPVEAQQQPCQYTGRSVHAMHTHAAFQARCPNTPDVTTAPH